MPKILVVADESWVVNDVRSALAETRYDVTVLANPHEIVDSYAAVQPDLAIIDLQVQSMGGMAITRSIRHAALAADAAIPPIVVLLDREVDAFLAKRAGAAARLRKPFNGFELRDTVDRLIAGESATDEGEPASAAAE